MVNSVSRREDHKVIDQLEQAAIKLASLSHSDEHDTEPCAFPEVTVVDGDSPAMIPMERLDQQSLSGTV
jgi:hypothetical protein